MKGKPEVPQVTIVDPDRIVDRGRGCYNCKHYENGELARNHYRVRRQMEERAAVAAGKGALVRLGADSLKGSTARVHRLAREHGLSENAAVDLALALENEQRIRKDADATLPGTSPESARFRVFDMAVSTGQLGVCVRGKAQGDFVHCQYLCDGWDGRDGHSLATSARPLDKLPDELMDRAEPKK